MKLKCDVCGDIESAKVNGYNFGDRILEGVLFEVKVVGKKLKTTEVEPSAKDYFKDLNEKKWLKEANDYLRNILDSGRADDELVCSKCGDQRVTVVNDDGSPLTISKPKTAIPLKIVPTSNILDILKGK
jgi:hypothetical protein